MAACYHCSSTLDEYLLAKVSRQDSCPKCGRDVRCCRNCTFYDPNAHWECREEVAEHVLDKEKANFCDHYTLNPQSKGAATNPKADLLSAAEALFKKK